MKPEELIIIAIGQNIWGKGSTIPEALKNMKKYGTSKNYILFACHPDTRVDSISGNLIYPLEFPPKEILRKGKI